MKLQLIHTDNYLIAVDDSKIGEGDLYLTPSRNVVKALYYDNRWKKITHHLPLNNAPVLEGIQLLPPLEDEAAKFAESEYPTTIDSFNEHGWDEAVGQRIIYEKAYNKAKEVYKYTEEDMRDAYNLGLDTHSKQNPNKVYDELIQSLCQPKLPTAFDTETKQYIYEI